MTEGQPVGHGSGDGWRTLSAEQVRALARRLIDVEPLLHRLDPAQMAARLGWRVCDDDRFASMVQADAGLGLTDCSAELWLDGDGRLVSSVSASICDNLRPRSAASAAFRQDVFAMATRALTEEFGAPTGSEPGRSPKLSWRMDVFTLQLTGNPVNVYLSLGRNSDLDDEAERSVEER